jgi:hypothetical protein
MRKWVGRLNFARGNLSRDRFEVVDAVGYYRVRDRMTGDFVGCAFRFVDAAQMAYDLSRHARQRGL